MQTKRPRYEAIVRLATEWGLPAPSMAETDCWVTPAMGAPGFGSAVEVRLLSLPRRGAPRRSRSTRYGSAFVYFVGGGNHIKIGLARDVAFRLATLRASSPIPLELLLAIPGDLTVEQRLHQRFAALRSHNEWFRAEEPILAFVRELKHRRGLQ